MSPKASVEAVGGRPQESAYKKAKRALIRAEALLAAKQAEAEELIMEGLEFDYSEADLRAVAKERLVVARDLNAAMELRNKLVREGGPETEIAQAKEQVSILMDAIYRLPTLGQTFAAWEDVDESMKVRPLGRPPLLVDVEIVRAAEAVAKAKEAVKEARLNASPEEIKAADKALKEQSATGRANGRPAIHDIGELYRQVKMARAKIRGILNGKDVGARVLSAKKKVLGRTRRSTEEKVAIQEELISSLLETIAEKEQGLVGEELEKHTLWKLRTQFREMLVSFEESGQPSIIEQAKLLRSIHDMEQAKFGRMTTKAPENVIAASKLLRSQGKGGSVVEAAKLTVAERAKYDQLMKKAETAKDLEAISNPSDLKALLSSMIKQSDAKGARTTKTKTQIAAVKDKDESAQAATGRAGEKRRDSTQRRRAH